TIELLKDALFVARWYPWTPIGHLNGHCAGCGPRRQRDRAARWRILDGIVQQIYQDLFDQDTVQRHQWQIDRQVRGQWMNAQARLQVRQRRANHLFERLPLLVDLEGPRFEARHLQQVTDQAVEAIGFFIDGLE